jgi:hypothetical protein
VYNHRLWDNPAFLKSAFYGGFHASAPRQAPQYRTPRAAFAATSPYAAFIPANKPAQPHPVASASLMAAFAARRNPASAQASAAQNAARSSFRPAAAPVKPKSHGYIDIPTTPQTREIRRCHAPIVPRGID